MWPAWGENRRNGLGKCCKRATPVASLPHQIRRSIQRRDARTGSKNAVNQDRHGPVSSRCPGCVPSDATMLRSDDGGVRGSVEGSATCQAPLSFHRQLQAHAFHTAPPLNASQTQKRPATGESIEARGRTIDPAVSFALSGRLYQVAPNPPDGGEPA